MQIFDVLLSWDNSAYLQSSYFLHSTSKNLCYKQFSFISAFQRDWGKVKLSESFKFKFSRQKMNRIKQDCF